VSETTATSEQRDALRGILSMLLSVLVFGSGCAGEAGLGAAANRPDHLFRNAFAFIPL